MPKLLGISVVLAGITSVLEDSENYEEPVILSIRYEFDEGTQQLTMIISTKYFADVLKRDYESIG